MPSVTVGYSGRYREIPYRPELPVQRLAVDAIREHGLKFAKNAGLRLHTHPGNKLLDHALTAKRARIKPGQRLILQLPSRPDLPEGPDS